MSLNLKTREQLRDLNAQQWADFKAHWPMHLWEFAKDAGVASVLGACLGLSLVIYLLERAA